VHLPAQQHAVGDQQRGAHRLHLDVVALDLVAVQAPQGDAIGAPLGPARQEVILARIEGHGLLHPTAIGPEHPAESPPVIVVAVAQGQQVDRPGIEAEHAEVVGERGVGRPEVERDAGGVAPAGDLDEMRQPVLGAQVGQLAGREGAEAPGHLLVLAQDVDVVVHHGGDGDAVHLVERSHQSTRLSSRYITLWRERTTSISAS